MGFFSNLGGQLLGGGIGQLVGGQKGRDVGASIGSTLGNALIPFKKGGMVKKTGPALLHKGELVVPKHLVKNVSKTVKKKIAAAKKPKAKKSKKM